MELQNQEDIEKRYYTIVDYHALTQKYVGRKTEKTKTEGANIGEEEDESVKH